MHCLCRWWKITSSGGLTDAAISHVVRNDTHVLNFLYTVRALSVAKHSAKLTSGPNCGGRQIESFCEVPRLFSAPFEYAKQIFLGPGLKLRVQEMHGLRHIPTEPHR